MLVENGAKIDIIDSEDRGILYLSIKYGYDKITEYLLEKNKDIIGINILDIKDKKKKIPLHYAIQKKKINIINKLLEYGSNPNISNIDGYNSLHLSIFTRDIEIVKILIKHIGNINSKCLSGETSLHLAVNLRLTNIALLLIESGININIQDYNHEFNVLHYVTTINQIQILKILLDKNININAQDVFGNTPLHYAVLFNDNELAQLLIDNGSNKDIKNNDGEYVETDKDELRNIKILSGGSGYTHTPDVVIIPTNGGENASAYATVVNGTAHSHPLQ